MGALKLLRQAEQYVPSSPELISLQEHIRRGSVGIETTPPGADIYVIDYSDPQAGDVNQWEHLGVAPLKTDSLPRDGFVRIRAVKAGFETFEGAGSPRSSRTIRIALSTRDETPHAGVDGLELCGAALLPIPHNP